MSDYKNTTVYNRAKHNEKNTYTVISNQLINDDRLSVTEIGIMLMILSNSDDYILNTSYLQTISGIGQIKFFKSIKLLTQFGYIEKQRIKGSVNWVINEIPTILDFNNSETNNIEINNIKSTSSNTLSEDNTPETLYSSTILDFNNSETNNIEINNSETNNIETNNIEIQSIISTNETSTDKKNNKERNNNINKVSSSSVPDKQYTVTGDNFSSLDDDDSDDISNISGLTKNHNTSISSDNLTNEYLINNYPILKEITKGISQLYIDNIQLHKLINKSIDEIAELAITYNKNDNDNHLNYLCLMILKKTKSDVLRDKANNICKEKHILYPSSY